MAVLITGGTGYIGSHLARKLIASGEDNIILLDNNINHGSIADIADKVVIHQGNIAEPLMLVELLRSADISCIIHLGAALLYPEHNTGAIMHSMSWAPITCLKWRG